MTSACINIYNFHFNLFVYSLVFCLRVYVSFSDLRMTHGGKNIVKSLSRRVKKWRHYNYITDYTWHMVYLTYVYLRFFVVVVFFLPLLKKLNPTVGPPYLSYIIYLYILFSLKIFQFNTVLFYRFWVNTIWRLYTIRILYVRTIMSYLVSKSIK